MGYKPGFKAADVPEDSGNGNYSPIPAGDYTVIIDKMEDKDTKSGGVGLNTVYQVVDGQHKGRLLFDFINVENKSEIAERIGRKRLCELSWACGFADAVDDTDKLLHKPFKVSVTVEKDNYKSNRDGCTVMQNVVKKIHFSKPDFSAALAVEEVIHGDRLDYPVGVEQEDDPLPF